MTGYARIIAAHGDGSSTVKLPDGTFVRIRSRRDLPDGVVLLTGHPVQSGLGGQE